MMGRELEGFDLEKSRFGRCNCKYVQKKKLSQCNKFSYFVCTPTSNHWLQNLEIKCVGKMKNTETEQ